ncbi:unnamed protein product [Caenorhabditis angaria]|uniref:N-acetyltransferase domain-containing protein n=1 Tax=Caenorhabditis angaria TaxID=860376 RepID=A0A9P1IF16_9PELO|nr:unnamed protein product [Caenorhabditis angaria]
MSGKKRKITDFFNGPCKEETGESLKCPKKSIFPTEPKKIAKKPEKREKLDLSQRILDVGQENIGNLHCEACNMIYSVDSPKEAERHRIFHNRFETTVNFNIEQNLIEILKTLPNQKIGQHRIVFICAKMAGKIVKTSVEYWMKFVNESVGYVSESTGLWDENRRVYLSMGLSAESEIFLAGILVAEKLEEAINEESGETTKKCKNDDWIVGIDRIWTHKIKRKLGIGSALLDAVTTRDTKFEHRKRRLRVAFSELSDEGRVFAQKYVGKHYENEPFLIY